MTPDGPGPELINGRLAMIGFFSVICVELYSNKTLFQQVREAPVAILAVVAAITVASLIPLVRVRFSHELQLPGACMLVQCNVHLAGRTNDCMKTCAHKLR
jgi:Chlorophyll A-B binding protein